MKLKLVKTINVFSNGSIHFRYNLESLIKKNNRNTFSKTDDKNFKLNQKKPTSFTVFSQSLKYKNRYR